MTLNQLQQLFSKNLKTPWADPSLISNFKPGGKIHLNQAFEIYHQSYLARLTLELERTYPAIRWVIGDQHFLKICHKFIESQPSVTYNLLFYGKEFADFMLANFSTQKIPFLHDLARLEWLYKEAYNRPRSNPMSEDQLLVLTQASDYRVQFIESLNILTSPFAIFELWSRREEPAYNFELINWLHPENLLIYKIRNKVTVTQIMPIEAEILKSLEGGASLNSTLADYSTQLSPDQTAQFLHLLKSSGIVEDVFIIED
jgi:hypothetical protein